MLESVTLGAETPRSHDIPASADPDMFREWYVSARLQAHIALGASVRSAPARPVCLAPCSICGKRTCPAVTSGALGCEPEAGAVMPGKHAATLEARAARKAARKATVWAGERPTTCQNPGCYGVPLRETFWDGILPDGNGHTHGLFCDLCALTRGHGPEAVKYHRAPRSRTFRKVAR